MASKRYRNVPLIWLLLLAASVHKIALVRAAPVLTTVVSSYETTRTAGLFVITETLLTTYVTTVQVETESQPTGSTQTESNDRTQSSTTASATNPTAATQQTTTNRGQTTQTTSNQNTQVTQQSDSSSRSSSQSSSSSSTQSTSTSTSLSQSQQSSQSSDTSAETTSDRTDQQQPATSTVTETRPGNASTQTADPNAASRASSSTSIGGGAIAGIVVAGLLALAVAAFIVWRCTRKRFGDLRGSDQDGDIKWPEMERNATHLQPLPTKPSGSHGIAMGDTMSNPNRSALEDEDDDDELSGLEHSAHSGSALNPGAVAAGYYDSGYQPVHQPNYNNGGGISPPPPSHPMFQPSTSPPLGPSQPYNNYNSGYH